MKKLIIRSFIITSFFISTSLFSAQSIRKSQRGIRDTIHTIPEAISYINTTVRNVPSDLNAFEQYEKKQSNGLIACTKFLSNAARNQLLQALIEIDSRITYWRYQKNHPWNYFVSKNPIKWITGPAQEKEITENLELLETYQGELYVILGNLAQRDADFERGYRDFFVTDYKKSYEWIDNVLESLARITVLVRKTGPNPFIARAVLLRGQLEQVSHFKEQLLSEIEETAIPSYIARNWLKSSVALLAMGYGYNNLYTQFTSAAGNAARSLQTITNPVVTTVKDLVNTRQGSADIFSVSLEITKNFVKDKGRKYGIDEEQQKKIIAGLEVDNYGLYQQFLNKIANQEQLSSLEQSRWFPWIEKVRSGVTQISELPDYVQGKINFYELVVFNQKKQLAGLFKVAFLTPTVLAFTGAYMGYQKLTEKNYTSLRRALAEINDLFVDDSRSLDNEQYGKMLYMIYVLKQRAQKELPEKDNMRASFIADLERIESRDTDVATKHRIVDNMYKKYPFLGLIQKK